MVHFTCRIIAVVGAVVLALAAGRLSAQQVDGGWISEWLIYPPILSGFGDTPGEDNIRLDYITDGEEVFESTMLPADAFEVEPDYFGASAGQGLVNAGVDFPEFGVQIAFGDRSTSPVSSVNRQIRSPTRSPM